MYMFEEEITQRVALKKQYEVEIIENKSEFVETALWQIDRVMGALRHVGIQNLAYQNVVNGDWIASLIFKLECYIMAVGGTVAEDDEADEGKWEGEEIALIKSLAEWLKQVADVFNTTNHTIDSESYSLNQIAINEIKRKNKLPIRRSPWLKPDDENCQSDAIDEP